MTSATAKVNLDSFEFAPLRSLDDFLLSSARFQIPNLRDLDKWGNRVVKNLLYYQTNYFVLFAAIVGLMTILNPVKILCGVFVVLIVALVQIHFVEKGESSRRHPSSTTELYQQKKYCMGATLVCGFLLLYWFEAVLLCVFTFLLPFSVSFVHASLRLRNIRNKLANTVESFGPSTPMSILLNSLNIQIDKMLS